MKTIIANPPFSVPWNTDESFLTDLRFAEYGKLAPKSKADFAFLQDMVYQLDDDGLMTVVLPHGVLFRGAAEGFIRRFLIETKNCLDAVIGLPANIFFGTSIPTCILVFKKNRSGKDGVLFIDSSKEFEKQKNKNNLTGENISKITDVYLNRKTVEKYSYLATLQEIAENDYNLNIPRYVDTFEAEPEIDIEAVMKSIDDLYVERQKLDVEIDRYFVELGLKEAKKKKQNNDKSQLDLF